MLLILLAIAVLAFRFWMALNALKARVDILERSGDRRFEEVTVARPDVQASRAVASPPPPPPPLPTPAPPFPAAPPLKRDPPAPAMSRARAEIAPNPRPPEALETRIGSRWLLYVGVVAIIVGVGYFEKLAMDNRWITETARVIQGGVIGLVLVAGGLRFARRGYRLYGQIISGSGIAVLYVSTYAAFNFYHLIGQPLAFGLMSAVTTLAAWLANRQRSQAFALVAVGGGFATPFLLPSSIDSQVALFGYDTILIAGTLVLSRRREWPTLNVVSYVFTVLTLVAWTRQFYEPYKYLVTQQFLTIFCAMFLYVLRGIWRSQHPSARAERAILLTAPVAYYFASLANLFLHNTAWLIYLTLLSLVGVLVGSRTRSWVRLVFWFAAAFPMLLWTVAHGLTSALGGRTWLVPGLSVWAGIYAFNLAGILAATVWSERRFTAADIALLHLNGIGAYLGAYLLMEPVRASACGPLAAAFAVLNGGMGGLLVRRFRDEALHFWALAFTLLTIAVGLQFEGPWITSAWAAEGTAIVWLGLRERRDWLTAGGLLLFADAVFRLLTLQFSVPPAGQILLLNERAMCGLFVIALTYGIAWAHRSYSVRRIRGVEVGLGLLAAKLLLLALAASEILAYWSLHPAPPFEPASQLIVSGLTAGAVIMWLGLRRQQEWLRGCGAAVVAAAVYFLFEIQLQPASHGYVSVMNGRAGAGVFAVLALYGLAAVHHRLGEHVTELMTNVAVLTTGASLLTLSFLTSEIDAFWAARGAAGVWSIAREGLHAMAWSAIGGLLVWRGLSMRRAWVRVVGGVLLLNGVSRLLELQFAEVGPTYVVLANARVIASLAAIAVLYGVARLYEAISDVPENRAGVPAALSLLANALGLTLLTSEITAYWHVHDAHDTLATSHLAREMMLSITWAVYATILIVVGLRRKYAPIRYFAIAVFVITIVKVFAIDLAELDRLYRVLSVIGLGVTLLLTSYLYQKLSTDTEST